MSVMTRIVDAHQGYETKVTSRGQLVVAPLDFSSPYFVSANVVDTGFNFVKPKAGMRFVITDILIDADRNVSASTPATIVVFEADSDTTATISTTILQIELLKNTGKEITGLNLIVTAGKWVNIKTSDATVNATLMGYYVTA